MSEITQGELTGRYKKGFLCKTFQLLCSECKQWYDVKNIPEYDDDEGYPYWGRPICPKCQLPNKNAKILTGICLSYYPEYVSIHDLFLLKKLTPTIANE